MEQASGRQRRRPCRRRTRWRHECPAKYPLIYGGQSGLDCVEIVLYLQVNPGSLPALSRGTNLVRYSDGLAPNLVWEASSDADGDRIANYRVQVSLRPDCAWPLVSSLDRDVRQGTSFRIPKGWLNPRTPFYWRVRAEDDKGNSGPWSKVFRFTTP